MTYSERLKYCRAEFIKYLESRDTENAKLYAILYSKLLREIGAQISSYSDRAALTAEAEKYDLYAAMITRYGITDAVKKAVPGEKTDIPKPVKKPPAAAFAPVGCENTENTDIDWAAAMFDRYSPATLRVTTESGCGTGFFITADGYFITNHHVIHEGSIIDKVITVENGNGRIKGSAEFINAHKKLDVALLKLKNFKGKTPFIPIVKDYSLVRPGIAMMIIGNGLNLGLAPTAGNVKFTHSVHNDNLVYTAPSNNGDSGSPVLNKAGECIGIHKSTTVSEQIGSKSIPIKGLSNATTAENIRSLLTKWGLGDKI